MDRELLIRRVGLLGDWFGITLSDTRLSGYVLELAKLPETSVAKGLGRAKMECRFFPSFAELLDLCGASQRPDAEAEAAWFNIRTYKNLKDMPLHKSSRRLAVIRAMGGRGEGSGCFGKWPINQEIGKYKEFIMRYQQLTLERREGVPHVIECES